MPKKQNINGFLRKSLGKEVADKVIYKIDKMIKKGVSAARIQKDITRYLVTNARRQAATAVVAKVWPSERIKVAWIWSKANSPITGNTPPTGAGQGSVARGMKK
jgi:hypothetical protein